MKGSRGGQSIAFAGLNRAGRGELEEAEFAEVGNEDEAVLAQIAKRPRRGRKGVKVVIGGLDFDRAR
jgi:hypothetical protein